MTSDSTVLTPAQIQAIDAQASVLMKQGIRLLGEEPPGPIDAALECFDRALALRRQLPVATNPLLGYGLAACWLNRADALMRLGDAAQIAVALRAYDEAIALLRVLPLAIDPRFPRRLAIAHQNRGLALQAQGQAALTAAIDAFENALGILEADDALPISDRQFLLAAVWLNLANARVSSETSEAAALARVAAHKAIALVNGSEDSDAAAAEVGLKARHVLCQAIARQLSAPPALGEKMPNDVHQATDSVDNGLALVRRWEHQGITRFRRVAYDLFRFGARVYARYQPQFLDEFIREQIDPRRSSVDYVESPEMRAAVEEAVALAGRI
jgi:tetratricopeptide (TPR) repeat protein